MASRITVDQEKHDGFGNGVIGAPDFSGLDKGGRVRLKQHVVGADRLQTVRRAVYDSPVSATRCVDDPRDMSLGHDNVVIAGGGLAAARTALALRDLKFAGRITLVSDEHHLPYDRPPLSKRFLQGKVAQDQIGLLTHDQLSRLAIEVRLAQRVNGLDRTVRSLRIADGNTIQYGNLVVATGARPMLLPTLEGFGNVHVLRTVDDASRLRQALQPGRRIGIVGAGFIGLEIAAVAIESGCHVCVLEAAPTPLATIIGTELGSSIQHWHERKGVRFHCSTQLVGVQGAERVETLELADGGALPVDDVVVGVGQVPNVEWLDGAGLEIHRGLVCDYHGRTLDPQIQVVGDAACLRIGGSYHPNRHWTATTDQAHRVAAVICGRPGPQAVNDDRYFWSDQHGSRLQFAGEVSANSRVVWKVGAADQDRFLALFCSGEHVTGVFSLGCPREFLAQRMSLSRSDQTVVRPA